VQIRTLLKRIEQAEKALQARSIFSTDCICFPENEPPFFCFPSEEEIAAKVRCPLHGNRFRQPIFHIYVAKWRRESEKKTPTTPEPAVPESLVGQLS
jgi:hypothetical protein